MKKKTKKQPPKKQRYEFLKKLFSTILGIKKPKELLDIPIEKRLLIASNAFWREM